MQLTPSQAQIAKDTHRFRVVNSGRRFGKTVLAVLEMFTKAYAKGDRRVCYIAPTYQQARDICWKELKKICQPVALAINESRLEITIKTQDGKESYIWLRGWESVETLRGQRFDFVVIDEVAMMRNFQENWEQVVSPTLTDVKGDALFISTPKGFNHFYDLYNKQDTDNDFKSFHFTTYDNPHIPIEEIERQKKSISEDSFAQEYLADFRKQEGLVFKEFQREKHLFDDFTQKGHITETVAGVDFGYTNPAAVIHVERDYDSNYWVTKEWYKTEKTEQQIAEYVSACNFNAVYPDPENASAIKVLEDKRVNVREVVKGKGSVTSGISKMKDLFKQGKLRIHKNCHNLISELETYVYEDESEDPVDENNHAIDALRYVVMMSSIIVPDETEDIGLYSTRYA